MRRGLEEESRRAFAILQDMLNAKKARIPPEVLSQAKGLAVLHVLRAGLKVNYRAGRGILIARLNNGDWSPPSFIKSSGLGVGLTIGVDVTNVVMVLNTESALKAFTVGTVTLGGNASAAAGPVGKTSEPFASILVSDDTVNILAPAAIYSYCVSKGLYLGISLEGSVFTIGKIENEEVYGAGISHESILSGFVEAPTFSRPLHSLLPRLSESTPSGDAQITEPTPLLFPERFNETCQYTEPDLWAPNSPIQKSKPPCYSTLAHNPAEDSSLLTCIALYDYYSDNPEDLKFQSGNLISVLYQGDDGWWLGRLVSGETGIFPKNYVQVMMTV